jgi:hypothetical protein
MEERYFELVSFIQGKMKVPNNNQTMHVISEPSENVRLPQLSIRNFSGHLPDWIILQETFMSLVGNNTNIPKVQKFHYLLPAIKSDAMRVIQHIQINEEGLQIAWELLLERYENERLITNTHIDNIMK